MNLGLGTLVAVSKTSETVEQEGLTEIIRKVWSSATKVPSWPIPPLRCQIYTIPADYGEVRAEGDIKPGCADQGIDLDDLSGFEFYPFRYDFCNVITKDCDVLLGQCLEISCPGSGPPVTR